MSTLAIRGSAYCLSCGYSLIRLTTNHCPECGHPFHLDHPITYRRTPLPTPSHAFVGALWKALVIGTLLAAACFAVSAVVPESELGLLLLLCALLLMLASFVIAARHPLFPSLLGWVAGFTWGFLISFSIMFSLRNGFVSVYWPTFLPTLVILPVAGILLSSPFWLLARQLRRQRCSRILARLVD